MILFYSTRGPYGYLCNFSKHPVAIDGLEFATNEHYYQFCKYRITDPEHAEKIRTAKKAWDAMNWGRDPTKEIEPKWEEIKVDVMENGLIAKFSQHLDIQKLLIATGEQELVEDSPIDWFWGWGKDHSGKNMLGKTLMRVRCNFCKN